MTRTTLFFLFLFLTTYSLAGQIWEERLREGAVEIEKGSNSIFIATPASIYEFSLSGTKRWEFSQGAFDIEAEEGNVYGTDGKEVFRLSNNILNWKVAPPNISKIYALSLGEKGVYISTDKGILRLDKGTGESEYIFEEELEYGSKAVEEGEGVVVNIKRGGKSEIVKIEEGSIRWAVESGEVWPEEIVKDKTVYYAAGLDGKVRAIANGRIIWELDLQSGITAKPALVGNTIIIATLRGEIYALNAGNGAVKWTAKLPAGIKKGLEIGEMGGKAVVFAAASDRSIYAVDVEEGRVVWKGGDGNIPTKPVFLQNILFFATKKIYAFESSRACSITYPPEGAILDKREIAVRGGYISKYSNPKVEVAINSGEWEEAKVEEKRWKYYISPEEKLGDGPNTIKCRVADSGGEERGPLFTQIIVIYDSNAPYGEIEAVIEGQKVEGERLLLKVYDRREGRELEKYSYSINGEEREVEKGPVELELGEGTHTIVIKKKGYKDKEVVVRIAGKGSVLPFIIAAVVILGVLVVLVLKKKGLILKGK